MIDTVPASSRAQTIGIWVLRGLVAALFLAAAFFKLTGQPMMVDEFNTIGLGQWFRVFTGVIELIGGVMILIPALSAYGAIVVLMVDLGAFVTQFAVLHGDIIHTIVIGVLILLLIYLQRHRLTGARY